MLKRKKYIIDKKFQLRTTFTIIGAITVVISLIIVLITSSIMVSSSKMKKIIDAEDNIVQFLTLKPQKVDDKFYNDVLKEVSTKHNTNTKDIKASIRNNEILLFTVLFIAIIGEIILYLMLIKITHRISGPIYVMSNYIKSIIDGKIPQMRNLRKKDELQEFYALFGKMVETIRKEKK
jgi:hypothetical protein